MTKMLLQKIGYHFTTPSLLTLALTHCSASEENNERLEFLGDGLVNCIIAEALYHKFPDAKEGELSRWRATLINRDTLADLAIRLDLGAFLILGPGEIKSGGKKRQSILSCAMESLIGAIYLDSGYLKTKECILRWYHPFLDNMTPASSHKDPKTQLQEYVQQLHLPLPSYTIELLTGEAHQQTFTIRCTIEGMDNDTIKTIGIGTSRRRAEQAAAVSMLGIIKK